LRTNEPSYQYYFKQFVFFGGQRGSQWNGPSWPYQTSQALTSMANFINNYNQDVVTRSDYLKILRLYTQQHYLADGKIDLVENYDPNLGGPIVYYYWSNHYNHSSYNNLIITGLCGIRPSETDTLVINPLIDNSIEYFCLDDVIYHGHKLTVVYDRDGTRYKAGKGLTALVDGEKVDLFQTGDKQAIIVGAPIVKHSPQLSIDYALNISHTGYPLPTASVNTTPDTSLYQAIDGRIWYFPEITNRWTTTGSIAKTDWFAIDFGQPREISTVKVYPVADNKSFQVPDGFEIEIQTGDKWIPVKTKGQQPSKPIGNTENTLVFDKVTTSRVRINFTHNRKQVAISEIECY